MTYNVCQVCKAQLLQEIKRCSRHSAVLMMMNDFILLTVVCDVVSCCYFLLRTINAQLLTGFTL